MAIPRSSRTSWRASMTTASPSRGWSSRATRSRLSTPAIFRRSVGAPKLKYLLDRLELRLTPAKAHGQQAGFHPRARYARSQQVGERSPAVGEHGVRLDTLA